MSDLIRLSDIGVDYAIPRQGRKKVLADLSLTIRTSEFIAVCGQTGCGKSTMLRLILGAEKPTCGKVLINGSELPRPDRHRGYVPQKYSLFPDKTVLGNIMFGPEMEEFGILGRLSPRFFRRRQEIRSEAYRLLAQMGLQESDALKYPDQLSGGMQQRVAIAQALIMHPQILLMDEAFSALDPGTRAEMQRLIRSVWANAGTTVLFVTHNIAEAIFLASRIVVLGKKDAGGSSNVLLDLDVPEEARTQSGYLRREELERLTRLIETAAMGGQPELRLVEFGG
ncbi:MAG TPA: ABC transporter ATP-binding protein [Bryobacteraceae bacterium]